MSRRLGTAARLALAFLAASVLLPVASADHAYSHRYIVFGRVVDAAGAPVPGVTVDLGYEEPFRPEGACANQPDTETAAKGPTRSTPITNEFGEFIFCFHTHSMSRTLPGTAILAVEGTEVGRRFEMDPYMRHSYEIVELPDTRANANADALTTTHTIEGTVWRATGGETFLENIRVQGVTIDQEPVNVTIEYNGRPPETFEAKTNNYGDFAIRVPIEGPITSGKVTLGVAGETRTFDLSPKYGVTSLKVELDEEANPFVQRFLIGLGLVVGLVVVGGASYFVNGRRKASREGRAVRERSTRKRSNR